MNIVSSYLCFLPLHRRIMIDHCHMSLNLCATKKVIFSSRWLKSTVLYKNGPRIQQKMETFPKDSETLHTINIAWYLKDVFFFNNIYINIYIPTSWIIWNQTIRTSGFMGMKSSGAARVVATQLYFLGIRRKFQLLLALKGRHVATGAVSYHRFSISLYIYTQYITVSLHIISFHQKKHRGMSATARWEEFCKPLVKIALTFTKKTYAFDNAGSQERGLCINLHTDLGAQKVSYNCFIMLTVMLGYWTVNLHKFTVRVLSFFKIDWCQDMSSSFRFQMLPPEKKQLGIPDGEGGCWQAGLPCSWGHTHLATAGETKLWTVT